MATNASQLAKTGKFGDLRRRLVFLLLALVVYRVGAHIPVPGIDPAQLAQFFKGQQGGILGMFNMFSGGALSRFTVFALGIMPYISASIIMQLLTYVLPTFEQLKKEGEAGRRKITQYTRYGTLGLALFQSMGIAIALELQQFRKSPRRTGHRMHCDAGKLEAARRISHSIEVNVESIGGAVAYRTDAEKRNSFRCRSKCNGQRLHLHRARA